MVVAICIKLSPKKGECIHKKNVTRVTKSPSDRKSVPFYFGFSKLDLSLIPGRNKENDEANFI
jgi:hypothetical protein